MQKKKKNKYSFIIYYYHSIFRIHQSSAPINYPVECSDRHLNVINNRHLIFLNRNNENKKLN